MIMNDKFKTLLNFLKVTSLVGGGIMFVAYHVHKTYKSINFIVNTRVLESEKKYKPEYIYIDDPLYYATVEEAINRETKQTVGVAKIWKSLKHSLAWRLLWLCKHGSPELRNIALDRLAAFKNHKAWDFCKLAQAMDPQTAVLLARTKGADNRYFLPPPIHVRREALDKHLLSITFLDMVSAMQALDPHSCIRHFLTKYNIKIEEAADSDHVAQKPDTISERDLCIQCLDALYHHLSLFHKSKFEDDTSTKLLLKLQILPKLAELLLRYPNDTDVDVAVLKISTILSVHQNLLLEFYQNGLIRDFNRLLKSIDVRLASSAAVCLVNLSGEMKYSPGLYLLYPLYRTKSPILCDLLLVHGLRGGVFVTWRQRDRKCAEPIGILEVTYADNECDSCEKKLYERNFVDPEFNEVIKEILELEEERLLSDFEVVLHDVPIDAKRDFYSNDSYSLYIKRSGLLQEEEDRCTYTYCWPKDWLPRDCTNLRVLGVNYWTSLSDWLERCPLLTADIASRAAELIPTLGDAGVGKGDKPLVWLAHSMGGLIVKELLIQSSECENCNVKKLCDNTKALLFYGTPHKGSKMATMPRAAAAILWPSNDVRQLQENCPVLLSLHEKFIKLADQYNWETISFAETLPTLITAFKVPVHFVETFSADLGRGVFYQLPLDHLSICKPATRQSIIYTTVLDVVQRASAQHTTAQYSNTWLQCLINLLHIMFRWKTISLDSPNIDQMKWIEKVLLDVFTDGFTD